MLWTNGDTLAAQTALLVVDVSQVVLNGNRTKVTLLLALAATNTANGTSLHGNRTLILVDTRNENAATLGAFFAKLDDVTRTSFHTSTTRGTLLFVDLRDSCFGVQVNSAELAGCNAITTTQAAKATSCFASTTNVHSGTGAQARILGNLGTVLASTVTTHYGNHRLGIGDGHPQQVGYLSHGLSATNRTHQSVEASGIGTLHKGIGHTATTRESASTAIGSGQQLAHLRNTGILIDSELLGGCKKHNSSYQGDSSKYNYCNQDEIHNLFVLVTIIISRY
jgi:hypothetical protein